MFESSYDYLIAFLFYIVYPVFFVLAPAVAYVVIAWQIYKEIKLKEVKYIYVLLLVLLIFPLVMYKFVMWIYKLDLYY